MPLLANATVSTTRRGAPVLASVRARIWPLGDALQIQLGIAKKHYKYMLDPGNDIQVGDVVIGYNPRDLATPHQLVVRSVASRDAVMSHIEGLLEATGATQSIV